MNDDNQMNQQTVFKEEQLENNHEKSKEKTSTGLEQNIAGLLCYLLGFITGIIFLLIEKENRFVRFHAIQSIIVSIALFILNIVLTAIPLIGWAIGLLLSPIYIILWIFLMWKAYQNTWLKLPIAGEIAENQLNKHS